MKGIISLALILVCACGDGLPRHARPARTSMATTDSASAQEGATHRPAQITDRRPLFVSELSPGEGTRVFQTAASPIYLRAEPSLAATVTDSLTVPIGTRIAPDEERYQTMAAGVISVTSPTQVSGRNLGPLQYLSRHQYYSDTFPVDTIDVGTGATIEYLMYRAEGTCFVRVDGNVIDAHYCPVGGYSVMGSDIRPISGAELVRDPEVQWWLHLTLDGERRGWALVEESTFRPARHDP